jgi:hypothetical protein
MLEQIPSMPGVNKSCLPWIICGIILAIIIFLTMKWSVEYGEKMYGEIEPSPKKQADNKNK